MALGGAGATFWMIVCGLLGMATKFAECTMGVKYRTQHEDGSFSGGPFKYMPVAFGRLFGKWPALVLTGIFAVAIFGFGVGGGNMFQANQTYVQAREVTGGEDGFLGSDGASLIFGLILAGLVAAVILGGIKSIGRVTSTLVPFMGIFYVVACLFVILSNIGHVPAAFQSIIEGAFTPQAGLGGLVGVLIVGFQRAAFSNEAGLGSAPNVAAVAEVKHPAAQGIVQSLSVFIDTLILCSCTALIILLSGVYQPGMEQAGVVLTQSAVAAVVGEWGRVFVSLALLLFVFTTLIYNYYLGENALGFFSQKRGPVMIYRVLVVGLVLWGSVQDLGTVFAFADVTMGLLAICNLIALALLFKVGLRLMRDYDSQIKAGVESPVLDAKQFADLDLDPAVWGNQPSSAADPAEIGDRAYQR